MDTNVTVTVAERVARGAALLDQAYVNRDVAWWDQVDLNTLDMYSPTSCVIAQTVGRYEGPHPCWCGAEGCEDATIGSYGDGLEVLGLMDSSVFSEDYGFAVGVHGHVALRNEWRDTILARRLGPVLPSES